MTDIVWYNIPDLLTPNKIIKDPYHRSLRLLMQKELLSPCILYFKNGKINFLEELIHTDKAINFLNKVGIHIFLYEPLCMYLSSKDKKPFTEEIPSSYLKEELFSDELESIKKYVIANKLTNVVVHTGDFNVDIVFKKYSSYMTLLCDDIFLKHFVVFKTETSDTLQFKRKFLCLNWRYTNHRQLIASYILDLDSKITWFFKQRFDQFKENLWFNIDNWDQKISKKIETNLIQLSLKSPITLDIKSPAKHAMDTIYPSQINPVAKNTKNKILDKEYFNSFCIIVTESRFAQPTANYSEKLFEAVRHKRPFILVAPPKTLEYFKSQGFKTFENFWDESYDLIENHEDRILKIFELIDYINSKTLEELSNIYVSMENILEHNYNHLVSISPMKSVQDV
jgi:hypothetical protein